MSTPPPRPRPDLRTRLSTLGRPSTLLRLRPLRPFRRWLRHRELWTAQRDSIARGVAVGLFFGILIPVAQIFFAAIFAVLLRANLAVTAVATLVTNPLTFPLVYYAAYRVGSALYPGNGRALRDVTLSERAAEQALEVGGWFSALVNWAGSVGPLLVVGLFVLAVAAAGAGYLVVQLAWRVAALWTGEHRRRKDAAGRSE